MLKALFKNRITDFRPWVFIALYMTLGILSGYYSEQSMVYVYVFGGVAALLALLDGIKNKDVAFLVLYFISFAGGMILMNLTLDSEPLPYGETKVTGRVTNAVHYDTRSYYILDEWTFEYNGETVSPYKELRIATEARDLEPGDRIAFSATLTLPDVRRNIGGFDERIYLLGKGVGYTAKGTVEDITFIDHTTTVQSLLSEVSTYFKRTIEAIFPDSTAGIAKGLVLGDKSDISEADYAIFQRGGTASILAVSGLHFGVLSLFVFWLMSILGVGRKPAHVITAVFMLAYAGIVGFTISATRALIMGLAVVFASLLGKKKDTLSYLAAAYVISLTILPASLFSAGFMLSFGAVFALLALTPILEKPLKKIPRRVSGLVTAPVAATIGTAPFIVNFFYYFSVVGILANIVVIPIGSLAVVTTFIAAILGRILGVPFAWASDKLIWLMQTITGKLTALPFATVDIPALPAGFIILWFAAIFVVSGYCLFKPWLKRTAAAILVVGMAAILVIPSLTQEKTLEIYFADVGQGDAILISTPEGTHYLVDTGKVYSTDELERVLKSQGIYLDGLFLTHADNDHIGGAETLLTDGLAAHLYLPYAGRNTFDLKTDTWTTYLEKGDTMNLSDSVALKVLSPAGDMDDENKNETSLCLLISYKDYRVLLTGDINLNVENDIMDEVGDIDVLKVTHHGTKYGSSPAFLTAVTPEIAVITCGENNYGHPAPQTLYNLADACDIIYRTDLNGGIMMSFGDTIKAVPVLPN